MTQTKNAAYMAQFSEAELAYFYNFPSWVQGSWAIAVWGAVFGSVLLLLRRKRAVGVFAVSLIAMVVTFAHNFVLADVKMYEVVGTEAIYVSAVIAIVAVALFLYARAMAQRGVLR